MKNPLHVGVATECISPEVGCHLFGYRPDLISTELHDDLTATALYFAQDNVKAIMISLTLCSVDGSICDRMREMIEAELGVPRQSVMIHAIHTHSGPVASRSVGWGEVDAEYCEKVMIPGTLRAAKRAVRGVVPAKMKISVGESLVGINRRQLTADNRVILGQNPWGPFDPRMTVISFADTAGTVIANLVHYGCHGTASGTNTQISRDWAGVMIDTLTEVSGGITAFFNGPEGDVGPRLANGRTVGERHVRYAMELGGIAARDAVRIYRRRGGYHTPSLSCSSDTLRIPLAPRPTRELAEAEYRKFEGETVNLKGKKRRYYEQILATYEEGYTEQEATFFEQTVIRLGDVAFVSLPHELFSEIGMRIAEASPIPYTLSLSNTNGRGDYFVTEDQLCRGGYEVDMFKTRFPQPYADNADHHAVTETLRHLNTLTEKGE